MVDYLDPQTLATVGPVDLRARMVVEGLMTGVHRSPFHGFSVEFAQHRPYAAGDDTRFLDWKVYGRTDKLYLKEYQKETNLDMFVLVDVSGSMAYSSQHVGNGPWRKFDYAATLGAVMTYLALRQQDRTALGLFSDQVRHATQLSNRQDHWRYIVEALSSAQLPDAGQGGRGDMGQVFDQIIARLSRRSLLVLISDLLDDPAALERSLARLHHRRHDLIVLQVLDPAELHFPFRQPCEFVGLESEGRITLDPPALRRSYLEVLARHLRQIQRITRKYRFDYLLMDTSQPLGPALSHFLAHRAAGIAKG